jgi:hypothetical protein
LKFFLLDARIAAFSLMMMNFGVLFTILLIEFLFS